MHATPPVERPVIFSAPMVRAVLSGCKTQTRRPILPQPMRPEVAPHCENGWWMWRVWTPEHAKHGAPSVRTGDRRCPYGVAGDRLWVRETWAAVFREPVPQMLPGDLLYRADGADAPWRRVWRPAIHMPRWASRITLEVTGVRVERLQEISEEDAKAEGVTPFHHDPEGDCWTTRRDVYRAAFEYLWGELNGWAGQPKARAPWASNPYVWVVEFKRSAP